MAIGDAASEKSLQDTVEELRETNKHLEIGFDPEQGELFKLGKKVDNLPKSLATMIGSGAGDTSGGVGGTEKSREDAAEKKKQTTLFESMAKSLKSIMNGIASMLKIMTQEAMGSVAGLLAAPIITLVSFFTQLRLEWLALKLLTKSFLKGGLFASGFKALNRAFGPKSSFGVFIKFLGRKTGISFLIGQIQKGLTTLVKPLKPIVGWFKTGVKPIGATMDGLKKGFTTLSNIIKAPIDYIKKIKNFQWVKDFALGFKNVGKMAAPFQFATGTVKIKEFKKTASIVGATFGTISNFFGSIKTFISGSKTFATIAKIGGTIGKILGKVFFPITLLMGIFDFVTGFMKGYEDEGSVFAGIKEGLAKVVGNLIGMPLDLLKKGVSWLLEFIFGENKVSEALDKLDFKKIVMDLVRLPFNLIQDAIKFVKKIFSWGKTKDAKTEGVDFSLSAMVSEAFGRIMKWFKNLFDFDMTAILKKIPGYETAAKFLGIGGDDKKEEETDKAMMVSDPNKLTGRMMELKKIIKEGAGFSNWSVEDEKAELIALQKRYLKLMEDTKQKNQGGQIVSAPVTANTKVGGDSTFVNTTSNRHPVMVGG